jgi:hypothetical protein
VPLDHAAAPLDHSAAHRARAAGYASSLQRTALRSWLLTLALFLAPLAAYWPATFHEYGLRDDYSNLREAHEEPGTILKFCASHGRPIYGWLLQSTYGQADSVQDLRWMRFGAALLLGAIGLVMFRGLLTLGWSLEAGVLFAALVELLPSSQVIAGWAVGWPYAATALLAILAFFLVEGALSARASAGAGRIAGQCLLALGILWTGALIYQPSAMFYAAPMAGAVIARRDRNLMQTARWLALHTGLVAIALVLAYATISTLYAHGVFPKSGRISFEQHPAEKLVWFFTEMLPNGLSMLVLNDDHGVDRAWYSGCAVLVGALLVIGLIREWRRFGGERGGIWALSLIGLPLFAAAISLVASERYATYRTIFAMSAVLLCFLVASVGSLTETWAPAARRLLSACVVGLAMFMAQHHVYALIAVPQGHEWQLIVEGARQVQLNATTKPRVFAIASSPGDLSTSTIYHDEFGSLSSNSEWVPREMFKRAMHDLHPEVPNIESRYEFSEGYRLPHGQHFDVVIDMHQLRRFHSGD